MKLFSTRRIKIFFGAILLGSILVYTVGYWYAIHSEPFLRACDFAKDDARIVAEIGPLTKCELSSRFSYNIRYNGLEGAAQFRLHVVGQKQAGELFIGLATNVGEWQVEGAKLKLPNDSFVAIK